MTNFGKRFRERARAASVAHEGFGVSFYTQTLGNKSHAKPRVVHFGKSFGKKARAAREGFWFRVDTRMLDNKTKTKRANNLGQRFRERALAAAVAHEGEGGEGLHKEAVWVQHQQ
jgi:hypothetical protein